MAWEVNDFEGPPPQLNTETELRGLTPAEQQSFLNRLPRNLAGNILDLTLGVPPINRRNGRNRPRSLTERFNNTNRRAAEEVARRAALEEERFAEYRAIEAQVLENLRPEREALEAARIREEERQAAAARAAMFEAPQRIRNRQEGIEAYNRKKARETSRIKRGQPIRRFQSKHTNKNYKATGPTTNKRNKRRRTRRRNV
jgi:hypothetical protein